MDKEAKLYELFLIVSRDVVEFRSDQECIEKCMRAILMVSNREDIEAICLHEAGHFAESVKLGLMVGFKESDIGFHAPRVIYNPDPMQISKFQPNPGSIFTPFRAQEVEWSLPILQQVTRVAVAGGVYAYELADRPIDKGTKGDCDLYKEYYRMAFKTLHAHPDLLIASRLWKWATRRVLRELRSHHHELQELARKRAVKFMEDHYRPFLEYSDLTR